MVKITIEGAGDFGKKMKALQTRINSNVKRAVSDSMRQHYRAIGRRFGDGAPMKNRDGALMRSRYIKTEGDKIENIVGLSVIGSAAAPYALVQQFGGIIRPKMKKMLAIPMARALTKAGRLKNQYSQWLGGVGSAFIKKTKSGAVMAVEKVGKGKRAKLRGIGILKNQVTLRPRLKFFETWNALAKARAARMDKAIADAINGVSS